MNDFDDSVLRDQLQRLGGHGPDEAGAYLALQQRVGVAKRRRAAAVVGGLGVTLMIGFAAAAYQPPSSSRLVPANGGGNDAVVTLPTTASNADTTSSSTAISTPTINGNTDDKGNNGNNGNTDSSAPQTGTDSTSPSPIDVPATTAHTVPHGHATTSAPATTTAPTVPATTTAPTIPATTSTEPSSSSSVPTNFTENATTSSSGGTATAHLQGGVVSLVSYSAAPDHDCVVERTLSDRVRITCRPTLFNTLGNTSHLDFSIGLDGHLVAVSTET